MDLDQTISDINRRLDRLEDDRAARRSPRRVLEKQNELQGQIWEKLAGHDRRFDPIDAQPKSLTRMVGEVSRRLPEQGE
jgi:hypothetical protein